MFSSHIGGILFIYTDLVWHSVSPDPGVDPRVGVDKGVVIEQHDVQYGQKDVGIIGSVSELTACERSMLENKGIVKEGEGDGK